MEVCNTDAEGRLILADAMAYVQKKYELESMVDIAGTGMATKQMDWIPQGGTGFGVQLLVDWLLNRYMKSLVCHKHVTHHNTNYSRLPAEEPW